MENSAGNCFVLNLKMEQKREYYYFLILPYDGNQKIPGIDIFVWKQKRDTVVRLSLKNLFENYLITSVSKRETNHKIQILWVSRDAK